MYKVIGWVLSALAALLLLSAASVYAGPDKVPPGPPPGPLLQGNPVAHTRVFVGYKEVIIHQQLPEDIPVVTWYNSKLQGCFEAATLQAHGIYSDWTVDVYWGATDQEPDVQIIYLPPPR